jgi:hypothetical protein
MKSVRALIAVNKRQLADVKSPKQSTENKVNASSQINGCPL